MQLSLPIPVSPTAAAPNQGAGNCPTAPTDQAASSTDSFDSFFPQTESDDKQPAAADTSPDAEKAAAILAASFWMPIAPVVTPPVAPVPSLTTGKAAVSESGESADNGTVDSKILSSCFAPTSSRSFVTPVPNSGGRSFQQTIAAASQDSVPTGVSVPVPQVPTNAPLTVAANTAATAASTTVETAVVAVNSQTLPPQTPPVAPAKTDLTIRGRAPVGASPTTGAQSVAKAGETTTELTDLNGAARGNSSANDNGSPDTSADSRNQEKIAAVAPLPVNELKTSGSTQEKYFVDPIQKAVTTATASVGISVAKVNAIMSAATTVRPKPASTSESTTSFVFSAEAAPTATLTVDAPAPVATVRETMAAVIHAVDALERSADVQQKSVDLQFHVGSEKLGLRVELRDGTIHTTFRTESSEMNTALTREWHSVVQPTGNRDIRLADPVFNTSPTTGSDSSSNLLGQGAPQQREQQKAQPTFASALKREFYDSTVSESASAISPVSNSSQLLNALA